MNTLSINIPANFVSGCEATLKRCDAARSDAERRAILNRETVQGIKWAIEFVNGLNTDYMNDKELNHAIRLTHFRGANCPAFCG